MVKHQALYYSGKAWANELARRGYAVLVHDSFGFGSRRVRAADLAEGVKGNLVERDPESNDEIEKYNQFAAQHEHIIGQPVSAGASMAGRIQLRGSAGVGLFVCASRCGCGAGGVLRIVGGRVANGDVIGVGPTH